MTTLERVYDKALQAYARFVMPSGAPGGRILVPLGNMGYGDLVFYLPTLRALDVLKPDIVIDDVDKREFLVSCGLNWVCSHKASEYAEYDSVVCHWLAQWTPIVRQIIAKRIPCRIGHVMEKRRWLWNHPVPFKPWHHWKLSNAALLMPLGLKPIEKRIVIDNPIAVAEVLIVPATTDSNRNWWGFGQVWSELYKAGHSIAVIDSKWEIPKLLRTIAGSKLVIGNDSGLPKIAHAMGVPAIQIFKSGCNPMSVAGIGNDLLDPTVDQVVARANEILAGGMNES